MAMKGKNDGKGTDVPVDVPVSVDGSTQVINIKQNDDGSYDIDNKSSAIVSIDGVLVTSEPTPEPTPEPIPEPTLDEVLVKYYSSLINVFDPSNKFISQGKSTNNLRSYLFDNYIHRLFDYKNLGGKKEFQDIQTKAQKNTPEGLAEILLALGENISFKPASLPMPIIDVESYFIGVSTEKIDDYKSEFIYFNSSVYNSVYNSNDKRSYFKNASLETQVTTIFDLASELSVYKNNFGEYNQLVKLLTNLNKSKKNKKDSVVATKSHEIGDTGIFVRFAALAAVLGTIGTISFYLYSLQPAHKVSSDTSSANSPDVLGYSIHDTSQTTSSDGSILIPAVIPAVCDYTESNEKIRELSSAIETCNLNQANQRRELDQCILNLSSYRSDLVDCKQNPEQYLTDSQIQSFCVDSVNPVEEPVKPKYAKLTPTLTEKLKSICPYDNVYLKLSDLTAPVKKSTVYGALNFAVRETVVGYLSEKKINLSPKDLENAIHTVSVYRINVLNVRFEEQNLGFNDNSELINQKYQDQNITRLKLSCKKVE